MGITKITKCCMIKFSEVNTKQMTTVINMPDDLLSELLNHFNSVS